MKKFIVSEEELQELTGKKRVDTKKLERYVPPEYTAIGPLDGRYSEIAEELSPFFSEFSLVKNRVKVEVLWLQFLLDNLDGSSEIIAKLKNGKAKIERVDVETDKGIVAKIKESSAVIDVTQIFNNFDYDDFEEIKKIEVEINHDVKAVELWVAEQVEKLGFPELKSYVHIGCTSEDITNPAYARMIADSLDEVWIPKVQQFMGLLQGMVLMYQEVPMLAYTHGQPATPTTVGKEMMVYVYRLRNAVERLKDIKPTAKFNGATGNYAAINIAFPEKNWQALAKNFVQMYLELEFNPVTTQIESHDYIVEIAAEMAHINRIIANFCSDMWTYISMEVFSQVTVKKEVGSSTMPHKVNPINFENGEANLRKSTSDLEFLCEQLMSTRMQRDLRDSTVLRNIGVAFGHSVLGIERTIKGIKRVEVNERLLGDILNENVEVLAEAIQTILRKYGIADAYSKLKDLTRGKKITYEALTEFLNSRETRAIPECERDALMMMRPEFYTGLASDIISDNILTK